MNPFSSEQTVIVHLDGKTLPEEIYEKYDLATLEDHLIEAIEAKSLGEFDGNEFRPEETLLFMYGPDAETQFEGIKPVLLAYPLCQNARVVIRNGGPGSPEREVILPKI